MKAEKERKHKNVGAAMMSAVSEMGRASREQQGDRCYYCVNEKCKKCAVATMTIGADYERDFGCKVWKSCEMISAGVTFFACRDCHDEIIGEVKEWWQEKKEKKSRHCRAKKK